MGESEECESGKDSPGASGVKPCFCAWAHHPLAVPKDVATLFLKVLKDSESAARPVGRYLLHAKNCRVSGPSSPAVVWVFVSCGILFSPLIRENSLGQKSYPRRNGKHIRQGICNI